MSKRSRGSRRTPQRRGGGRPNQQRAPRPQRTIVTSEPVIASTDALESSPEPAAQSPAADAPSPTRAVARTRSRPSGLLEARAAAEYVYVAQDIRRIIAVAGLLFLAMLVLWFLIVVARVIRF